MEKLNGITINKNSLVWHRKLGEGRDAVVYSAPHNKAYKIYKNPADKDYIGVLRMIQENKYDIRLSHLPQGAIYYNNDYFAGCILERVYGNQIHKVFQMLSRENQIKVLKRVVAAVKELTSNCIYPYDLANTPLLNGKRSNIFIDKKLNVELLDLDGSGTIYRDKPNRTDQEYVNNGLSILFLDLLLDTAVSDDPENIEIEYYKNKLIELGFDKMVAKRLSMYEADYEVIDEAIDVYSHMPILKH